MLKYLDAFDDSGKKDAEIAAYKTQIANNESKIADLEHRNNYLEKIIETSQILNNILELTPLLEKIAHIIPQLTSTESCSILLYHKKTKQLKFMPTTQTTTNTENLEIFVPLDNSIAGWVYRKVRPILIRDVKNDPRWHSKVVGTSNLEVLSILGVPLKIKQDVIGVMELINKQDENGFDQDDIQIASILATQVAIAIKNARLWDDIQHAHQEMLELDQLKNDFVSIASQELENPLNIILDYATYLQKQPSNQETEQLELLLNSASKLRKLIESMINLRHIKHNEDNLNINIFSMRKLVEDTLAGLQNFIDIKSLRVKVRYTEGNDPIDIEGDRDKIYLVIVNLLSNAIKFTPENGIILVGLSRIKQTIYLRVADTGIGISEEQLENLFNEVQPLNPSKTRRFDGLGIGLPIVKRIIEAHNGKINVDSVIGKGTQFTISLPISIYL